VKKKFVLHCSSEGEGYFSVVAQDYSEVYCTKLTGYEKKTVYKLEEDAAKKAAYEAEQAAKEQEKLNKENAKESAKLILKDCKVNDKFDKDCFQKLLDYLEL